MVKRNLKDLVIVLLHTQNRDIWHFVTKRIKLQVNGRAKLQPTTFCKGMLKDPMEWLSGSIQIITEFLYHDLKEYWVQYKQMSSLCSYKKY